jgi:quercetin dioxygenase-like cupin family protein
MAEITREVLQDLLIPEQVTGRVQVRRITIPAGAETAPHTHNGPVFGAVVSGRAHVQVDGGEVTTVGPGEVFFEPAETRIDRFDGADGELVFLAWFPVPDGVEPLLSPL